MRLRYWCLLLLLPVVGLLYGLHRDVCACCGAERHRWLLSACLPYEDITMTSLSTRVAAVLGQPCEHHQWFFTSSASILGAGDNFAVFSTPLHRLKNHGLLEGVARLPELSLRRRAWQAITDTKNHLRWAACVVLVNLSTQPTLSSSGARTWWQENQAYLSPEYDLDAARTKAAPLLPAIDRDLPGFWFAGPELERELRKGR